MAAYAATVTAPDLVAKKLAATGLGILRGSVALSNYNTVLAEITGITGKFRSAPTVLLGGCSSNGYIVAWDSASQSIKAFYPTRAITPAGSISAPAFTGAASAGTRELPFSPGGGDIKGSANTDVGIAGGTLQTNGGLLSNLADAANTNNFTMALQPDVSRNVCIAFKNTNAGASTGNAVGCVITGTFRGAAQTETINFSALELTSTVQNEVATKYGSKPFDTITSITNPVAQPANWQHAAGPGSKIGLPVDLSTPAEADVVKLTKNAANLAPAGLVDTANMTVNFDTLADGDDVAILFKVDEAALTPAGTVAAPVLTGTPVSAQAGSEVVNDVNVGTIQFVAVGPAP
jgi:hypothetical protein